MPYVERRYRDELDPHIERLSDVITGLSSLPKEQLVSAGLLNYAFTRILVRTLPQRSYWAMALGIGTLVCTIFEFYRRVVTPHEERAIERNGDVEEYRR